MAPQAALEQSQAIAASAYATEHGVSVERARSVLSMQAKAAGLQEALRNALGSTYGEIWFDNNADEVVVDTGPGASQSTTQKVLGRFGLANRSRVEQKPWNDAGLKEEVSVLGQRLSPYITTGEIQVGIVANDGVQISVAREASSADRAVVTSVATEPQARSGTAGPSQNIVMPVVRNSTQSKFGGSPLSYVSPGYGGPPLISGEVYENAILRLDCTMGFEASSPNGGTYFLTAGHCIDVGPSGSDAACISPSFCSGFGNDVGGFVGAGGDAGVLQDRSTIWPGYPAFIDYNCCSGTLPVFGVAQPALKQYVCHTGFGSAYVGQPGTTCGEVVKLQVPVQYGPPWNTTVYLDALAGDCAFPGDSGGPVFSPYNAYALGIIDYGNSGCGGGITTYFSDVYLTSKYLGVSVQIY
jgi:hypothetical protein